MSELKIFPCLGNYWLNVLKETMVVNKQIVLTTNLLELLTFNKCLRDFFASICNINVVLQN